MRFRVDYLRRGVRTSKVVENAVYKDVPRLISEDDAVDVWEIDENGKVIQSLGTIAAGMPI
ncbi:MAG: hypothetical protein ABSD38_20975 [Syntrophorhabdales bacterium]|jgi:hypothetical protein